MTSVYTLLNNEVESSNPVSGLKSGLRNGSGYVKGSGFINQRVSVDRNQKFRSTETISFG